MIGQQKITIISEISFFNKPLAKQSHWLIDIRYDETNWNVRPIQKSGTYFLVFLWSFQYFSAFLCVANRSRTQK